MLTAAAAAIAMGGIFFTPLFFPVAAKHKRRSLSCARAYRSPSEESLSCNVGKQPPFSALAALALCLC